MSIADYSPHATARRFDSGTPPVPSLYPGVAGMELIAEVGVPAIEAHVRGLVDRLLAGLDELGATVATVTRRSEYGPLICVVSTDPNALVDALAGEQHRHLDARLEPPDLAPPLQRRGGRRPDPRGARGAPRASRLTLGGVGPGGLCRRRVVARATALRPLARPAADDQVLLVVLPARAAERARAGRAPATIPKQSTQYAIGQCSSRDRRCANACDDALVRARPHMPRAASGACRAA